jgi:hypothetical protein
MFMIPHYLQAQVQLQILHINPLSQCQTQSHITSNPTDFTPTSIIRHTSESSLILTLPFIYSRNH